MKKIEKMIHHIKDELEGAEHYAEKYVMYKNTNSEWANLFHQMSIDELDHADSLHKMSEEFISKLPYIPEKDEEDWDRCVKRISETTASVRLLLSK